MSENQSNRRDVLKTIGVASSLGVVGSIPVNAEKMGTVHLLEAKIVYDIPETDDYLGGHFNMLAPYKIDGKSERLFITDVATSNEERVLLKRDEVVNHVDQQLTAPPSTATLEAPALTLPISADSTRKWGRFVELASPVAVPTVNIRRLNNRFVVEANRRRIDVSNHSRHSLVLDEHDIHIKQKIDTGEKEEIDGLHPSQWGTKSRIETKSVTAEAKLVVEDYGVLDVYNGIDEQ